VNLIRIDDPDDPRVADYRGVRDPEWLRRRGRFLAEGRRAVELLLAQPDLRAHSVLLTDTSLAALRACLEQLDAATPVYLADASVLVALSGVRFVQGCVAAGERVRTPDLDGFLRELGSTGPARLLALDCVTNPDNIGGLFRNALAFGAAGVVLSARTSSPLYRKAIRTSQGATLRLPWVSAADWPAALAALGHAGFTRLALTPHGAEAELVDFGRVRPYPARVALLLGAEGEGLGPESLAAADVRVRIPLAPGVDSLNVATAAAIALHHFAS
jgi:tRNA G18 (ribose-2'-O)-methylase SpoU